MSKVSKYFIVEASALPEIFLKVARAKEALELGEAATVNEATRMAGISRSAFYKYKDAVRPFNDMMNGHIVTFQAMLRDEPGALSAILNIFAASGGNILTINQTIPTGSVAAVNLSAETSGLNVSLDELVHRVSAMEGVVKFEVLAG
ncbi:MAG: ACT domain-containing protein [Clostridiales bacterium]|nr:ACT domain-containing protein [Clostridiales bacterium]MCD7886566.1 ACT domain-containing protein [Clostridiales bacterium]